MKTIIKLLIALSLVAATLFYYFSPQYSLAKLNAAAQSGQVQLLENHIDFPVLRENVKAKLNQRFTPEPQADSNNLFSGLGNALVGMFVGPLVDSLITPEGMLDLLNDSSSNQGPTYRETRYRDLNHFEVNVRSLEDNQLVLRLHFERRGFAQWLLVDLHHPLLEERAAAQ